MPEITETELIRRLTVAVENVRHRNLQKRINKSNPDIPKAVKSRGSDWHPCEVCKEEVLLILNELRKFE